MLHQEYLKLVTRQFLLHDLKGVKLTMVPLNANNMSRGKLHVGRIRFAKRV